VSGKLAPVDAGNELWKGSDRAVRAHAVLVGVAVAVRAVSGQAPDQPRRAAGATSGWLQARSVRSGGGCSAAGQGELEAPLPRPADGQVQG